MTNDPAAVKWLEDQFEKEFRPGGGQRIDMGHWGERGEAAFGGWFICPHCGDLRAPQGLVHTCGSGVTFVRHEAAPVLPRRTRLAWLRKLWGH